MTQAQVKGATTAKELWRRYEEGGFYLSFSPEQVRFTHALWQRLAQTAQPIPMEAALQLAGSAGLGRQVAADLLEWSTERGDQGELRGVFALSLNEHPHKVAVYGNELRTWCALDSLFVVPALGQPAVVTSRDPESGNEITVTYDGRRVSSVEPQSAVVSMIVGKEEPHSVLDIWSIFCEHLHFFENGETAQSFLSKREDEFYWLTVGEAYEFGDAIFNPESTLRRENLDRLDQDIDCSLDGGSFGERVEEWMSLARGSLLQFRRIDDSVVLSFAGEERVEEELRRLAELEAACCPFLAFSISREDGKVLAEITAPKEASAVLDLFLELPTAV